VEYGHPHYINIIHSTPPWMSMKDMPR